MEQKLDFRFAEPEDAEDIASFVDKLHGCESDINDRRFYRSSGPKIVKLQVEEDLDKSNVRWLVLETPYPDETIVAALRLRTNKNTDRIEIELLCAIGDINVQEKILGYLLKKVEGIAHHFLISTLVVSITQWDIDLDKILTNVGYEELGGSLDSSPDVLKPTMILEYHKKLTFISTTTISVPPQVIDINLTVDPIETNLNDIILDEVSNNITIDNDILSLDVNISEITNDEEDLEGLVRNLFVALRKNCDTNGNLNI
eukprot:gene7047-9622_t